ncbi:MAG: substrate-binding domain-containing protein [Haloferacaceae archaeon]
MVSRRALLAGVGVAAGVGGGVEAVRTRPWSDPPATALVAGSLLAVAHEVPNGTVEARGSAAVRRLILDGLRDPDAVALADPRLFAGVAARPTLFATNALVLAYDPASPHAADLRADWQATLADPAVTLGRTNPDTDPLGYRTVMALRLADRRGWVDAGAVLSNAALFPETGLLNAVSGGAVDVAACYRNMAVERDLPYVDLPPAIDFSTPTRADSYASVEYDLDGRTIRGAPIRYAAAARTDTGEAWTSALVDGADRLRAAGFGVPDAYPRETTVEGDEPGSS